jgi:hypothetical protein
MALATSAAGVGGSSSLGSGVVVMMGGGHVVVKVMYVYSYEMNPFRLMFLWFGGARAPALPDR